MESLSQEGCTWRLGPVVVVLVEVLQGLEDLGDPCSLTQVIAEQGKTLLAQAPFLLVGEAAVAERPSCPLLLGCTLGSMV